MRTFAPAAAAPGPDGWTAYEWPRTGAEPHALVALRIPHRFSPGERYMREGWQSWSTPMPGRIGDGVRRIGGRHPPRTARRHWLATPPYVGDESYHLWRSASATAYVEPCNAVFVATPEALLVVREQPVSDYHPRVWFAQRPVPETELADRVALRPLAQPYAGWSSWDVYGPAVRGDDLLDELTTIERGFSDTIEVINVDDGWQRALGDWFPRGRRMAHAIGAVADRRRLSLWWAPFVVHPTARLAAEHPDWILRGHDGRPIVVLSRAELWEAWALDLSSLDVLGWLGDTARRLAGYGAQLLKCDFLYASAYTADAARRRACADPLVTAEDVHRRALTAIRGAGPAIVASGAPLWPSAGLVDFMRVGPDAGRRWWKPAPPGLEPEFAGGCLANAAAGAQRRHWLHHAAWLNDPDSVYLRACPRWLDWVAAHGLPMVLSEPMRSLNRTERHRWATAVNRQRTAAADVIPPGPARWDATGSPDR